METKKMRQSRARRERLEDEKAARLAPVEVTPDDYAWTSDKAVNFLAKMARNPAVDEEVRAEAQQLILLIVGALDRYTDWAGREWVTVERHRILNG